MLKLAPEAHQFFLTGEPEIADRYFPWLVNLMSPAYWVYLLMAVTVLFNGLRAFSRFRLGGSMQRVRNLSRLSRSL
jgi:hypothetical protein